MCKSEKSLKRVIILLTITEYSDTLYHKEGVSVMKSIAYALMHIISIVFFVKLGKADGHEDAKKKKALWINAGAFTIGFLASMLFFL